MHAVANPELSKYKDVLNKALVVERDLVDVMKKKDEESNKRSEPASGFNQSGQQESLVTEDLVKM